MKEARRLGFENPDDALRARWEEVPSWLQENLLDLGFEI